MFSTEEEASIVTAVAVLGDWSFPLTPFEIRLLAKSVLDKQGRIVDRFPNNLPGKDWAINFLKRHRDEIKVRLANNLSQGRAELSPEQVKEFFVNLEKELQGVPPTNIINYDETNLTDDIGRKRCVFKRSCRYPNRVAPSTKTGFSVMFAGAADGTVYPPYTVWNRIGCVLHPCATSICYRSTKQKICTRLGWREGQKGPVTIAARVDGFTQSALKIGSCL